VLTRCVMSLPERVQIGACLGYIPESRRRRGSHFCSRECHQEYRRQMRQELAKRKCRYCGRRKRQEKLLRAWRSAPRAFEQAGQ